MFHKHIIYIKQDKKEAGITDCSAGRIVSPLCISG